MLTLQLLGSFFVGGALIASISLLAEKAPSNVAGVIISLPSTIVVSYFFIALVLTPQAIKDIAPLAPAVSGIIMIFTITYLQLSRIKIKKLYSIILSTSGSLLIWFLLAIPLAIFHFSNLLISLLIYIFCITIAYFAISKRPNLKTTRIKIEYSGLQKIERAVFAGSVVALSVFLAKTLNPFWGGIFSLFPAAFLSSLILLHKSHSSDFLFQVWKNSPLGTIVFVVYPLTAMYTFPAFGILAGTALAYLSSILSFILISKLQKVIA